MSSKKASKDPKKGPQWNIWNQPRQANAKGSDIILFDESSRKEYVTGFGQRKLQRKYIAKEAIKAAEKQMRKEDRVKRRNEAETYTKELLEATYDDGEAGTYLSNDKDEKKKLDERKKESQLAAVGSSAVFEGEDGGRVTTTIEAFDETDDEMPGLIPVSELKKTHMQGILNAKHHKSSDNKQNHKKRPNDHNKDRQGSHKKFKR